MSVLSDKTIRKLAIEDSMISPFVDKQVRDGKISYGLSSFGYDARVSDEFKIFHNVNSSIVDPKKFTSDNFVTKKSSEYIIIPPNSFALGTTIEIFKILIKYSNLKYPYMDHKLHENIIENSSIDWTILRPTVLTNEKNYHEVKVCQRKDDNPRLTISRKALAKFIIKIIDDKSYFKKKLTVSRK